jgi:hypothetical protein
VEVRQAREEDEGRREGGFNASGSSIACFRSLGSTGEVLGLILVYHRKELQQSRLLERDNARRDNARIE